MREVPGYEDEGRGSEGAGAGPAGGGGREPEPVPPLAPELKARIDRMAADFMPQVRAEAWKVYQRAPHALDLDELVALGLLGLAQATAKWAEYCHKRGFDPNRTEYFIAYVLRRVRGAMLDALRSQDWVTRSARTRAKILRDNGQDQGISEAELARLSGMSIEDVRETIAAVAARPVSLDAEPHDVAAQAGTESQAMVSSLLGAATGIILSQPPQAQAVVILRYYYNYSVSEIAEMLGTAEEEVARLQTEAIQAVHNAMLRAVT